MIIVEKKNGLYHLNISDRGEYRKQRSNAIEPHSTCNITAMMMCLKIKDYHEHTPFDKMFKDIYDIIETDPEINNIYNTRYAKYRDQYSKKELHRLLSMGVNKYMGKQVTTFHNKYPLRNIVFELMNDSPAVISGFFHVYHHIVALVGVVVADPDKIIYPQLVEDVDMDNILYYIIDDPYGMYGKKYKNHNGDNVLVPAEEFVKIIKPYNDMAKRVHRFIV